VGESHAEGHGFKYSAQSLRAAGATCENRSTIDDPHSLMNSQKYDFRQFQEELAKLERKVEKQQPSKPLGKKAVAAQRLAMAREEFLVLRKRHDLTVADVVAFFPEEEGIAYLQQLIAAAQAKPRRTRKVAEVPNAG
jgi:hypothetical protein